MCGSTMKKDRRQPGACFTRRTFLRTSAGAVAPLFVPQARAARALRLVLQGRGLDEVVRPTGVPLRFRTRDGATGSDVELAPFHRIAHERYSLHWEVA